MVAEFEKFSEQFLWKTGNISVKTASIDDSSYCLGASLIQELLHRITKRIKFAWNALCSDGRSLVGEDGTSAQCLLCNLTALTVSFESSLPFSIVCLTLQHSCVPLAL